MFVFLILIVVNYKIHRNRNLDDIEFCCLRQLKIIELKTRQ